MTEDRGRIAPITVIATDLEPGKLKPGLSRDELIAQLRGHALAPASIVGRYTRPSPTQ
jgi:hypothetical protein